MKSHDVVVVFRDATQPDQSWDTEVVLKRVLKGVRVIYLMEYGLRLPAGLVTVAEQTYRVRLDARLMSDESSTHPNSGLLIWAGPHSAGAGGNQGTHYEYTHPRMISCAEVPALTRFRVLVDDYLGGPVQAGEMFFRFRIMYDGDYTDLNVVQAEQGLRETVSGQHGHRHWWVPAEEAQQQVFDAMRDHVFSQM